MTDHPGVLAAETASSTTEAELIRLCGRLIELQREERLAYATIDDDLERDRVLAPGVAEWRRIENDGTISIGCLKD